MSLVCSVIFIHHAFNANILDKDYLQWVKELCKRYMPDAEGLSERNLRYTKKLYQLYSQEIRILQQLAANSGS